MSDGAPVEPEPTSLRSALARLADATLGLVRTRLELVIVEFSEERGRLGQQLALLIAGIVSVLIAVLFAAAGVVAYFWTTHRMEAIIGVVVVFAAAGAVLLWRRAAVARTAPMPFAASLTELEKDRAAISRSAPPPAL